MDELDHIARRVVEGGGPWTIELYPTLACNLDCRFCDTAPRHVKPVDELDEAQWLRIVDEAADMGARRAMVLGGGEPLLSPHAPALMRRIKARGLSGMLTSNGTLLTAPVRALLLDIGWDEVHLSIDGARARTHDALRGRPGAFRRTVSHACRLRAERDQRGLAAPRIVIHTVLTRANVDELAELARLGAAVGADRVELDALVAYRPEQVALQLGPAESARLSGRVAEGLEAAREVGVATNYARFVEVRVTERGQHAPAAGPGEGLRAAPCLKPFHHLAVTADGRLSPCCVLAGEGESLRRRPVAEAWAASPYLSRLRAGMLRGVATGRCAECSENILVHERAIRARIPA
ncbi:MAG: radical SAM protein [Deltaproteobacteria bacterium]|nr:radical SAM protein [Deltaproteobacteria bacterium]